MYILRADKKERIDIFLSEKLKYTRSYVQKLIKKGYVRVNKSVVKSSYVLKKHDLIEVQEMPPEKLNVVKENKPLEIVYQDKYLAIVNKEAGIIVHPAGRKKENTLVNRLLFHLDGLSGIGGVVRPGIVHRLDKDTSGLLVVAKTNEAHLKLSEMLKKHQIDRRYIALLKGHLDNRIGTIDIPLTKKGGGEIKIIVSPSGRYAVTHYRVIEEIGPYSLVIARLETGRTHQIRVHFAYIGHPVVQDYLYGGRINENISLNRQFLHAYEISFIHPIIGKRVTAYALLPEDLQKALKELRAKWKKKK